MTRAKRGLQKSVSGRMGYRETFFRTWVVRSLRNVAVVLVRNLERKGRRWHRLGNVIFGRTLTSRMSIGSTPFSFRPAIISWRELRLTLGRSRRGRHLDVLNRSGGGKPMDCPWSFSRT